MCCAVRVGRCVGRARDAFRAYFFGSLFLRQTPSQIGFRRRRLLVSRSPRAQTHTICYQAPAFIHTHPPANRTTSQNGVLQYSILGKVTSEVVVTLYATRCEVFGRTNHRRTRAERTRCDAVRGPVSAAAQPRWPSGDSARIRARRCRLRPRLPLPRTRARCTRSSWRSQRAAARLAPEPFLRRASSQKGSMAIGLRSLTARFFGSPRAADPTKKISHHKS